MHKIMAGLVSVAQMEDTSVAGTALSVASELGDWVYGRTSSCSKDSVVYSATLDSGLGVAAVAVIGAGAGFMVYKKKKKH